MSLLQIVENDAMIATVKQNLAEETTRANNTIAALEMENKYGLHHIPSNYEYGNIKADQEVARRAYLTTLLDSPEMVEKLATVAKKYYDDNKRKDYRLYNAFTTKEERKLITKEAWNNLITAVIAAIKKEAGI